LETRGAAGAEPAAPQACQCTAAPTHRVTIYVLPDCGNCDYAREIAALIRHEYPQVEIAVVDLANPAEPVPDAVFATPTYLLDGRLWSLGNPSPEQVRERLDQLEA
jgi:hypothetical protein